MSGHYSANLFILLFRVAKEMVPAQRDLKVLGIIVEHYIPFHSEVEQVPVLLIDPLLKSYLMRKCILKTHVPILFHRIRPSPERMNLNSSCYAEVSDDVGREQTDLLLRNLVVEKLSIIF